MITKCLKFFSFLLIILTCAGCLKSPIQRPKNLKPLTKETAQDSQTKEAVTVYTKKLNAADQTEIFGKYAGQQLQRCHIVPVQITVENQSTTAWVLADKNVALNKLTIDEVNAKLFASRRWLPLWICLGGVAGTIIIAPLIGIAVAAHLCATIPTCVGVNAGVGGCLAWPILGITCGVGAFAIAGGVLFVTTTCVMTVAAVSNHMSRNEMQRYLKTYCTPEGLILNEGMSASMLFFIEESQLPEKLNLVLTDKASEKHTLPFELAI